MFAKAFESCYDKFSELVNPVLDAAKPPLEFYGQQLESLTRKQFEFVGEIVSRGHGFSKKIMDLAEKTTEASARWWIDTVEGTQHP